MMFSEDEDVDAPEVDEENDDEDDLNYFEPDDFDDPDDKYDEFTDVDGKNNGTEVLSLQNICLLSISKNLERFNLAFTTTEDSNFQRNLQFLQRAHSSYLIKATTKYSKKLNELYFDFLLNQYIKEFNMEILFKCDWDAVIKRMSEIGHGFQKVLFKFPFQLPKSTDFINKVVCHLPNVEILEMNSNCKDSTLEIVASTCHQLKELYIEDCRVTDEGLKSLCNSGNGSCLNLRHLSVSGVLNIDDGLAYLLQNMPSLEVIVHRNLPYILHKMHKDSMNNTLKKTYNLTSLYLGPSLPWEETKSINEILTLYAEICPHLKNLSLSLESKENLDLCLKFPELEEFSSSKVCNSATLDMNEFLKSRGELLQKLKLDDFTLSVAVLTQNCRKLESLSLQNITFQPLDPGTILQPLNNVQELSLGYFSLSDKLIQCSVIDILKCCQNIEKLTLLCVQFENNEEFITKLSKFCENETLKCLTFRSCDVDDAFLQSVLLTCSNLNVLTVEYCDNITANHIDNLYEISNSLKSKTEIIWNDDRSEFNSLDSGDDIYDDFSGYDTDFDNHDDFEPYDSDNIYYGGYDDIDEY